MRFNLREKCHESSKREFFYGAKINRNIKDIYLGLCFLEPGESDRKAGPGKGHEELLYLMRGKIQVKVKDKEILLNEGEVFFITDGLKVLLKNLTEVRSYFMIAGGHTKHHKH
ncbi:MAG: hypothetical protein ACFFAN_11125 [Promethearchaeota archaeon]